MPSLGWTVNCQDCVYVRYRLGGRIASEGRAVHHKVGYNHSVEVYAADNKEETMTVFAANLSPVTIESILGEE